MSSISDELEELRKAKQNADCGEVYFSQIGKLSKDALTHLAVKIKARETKIELKQAEINKLQDEIKAYKKEIKETSDIIQDYMIQIPVAYPAIDEPLEGIKPPPPMVLGPYQVHIHMAQKVAITTTAPPELYSFRLQYSDFIRVKHSWNKIELGKALRDKDNIHNKYASDIAKYETVPELRITNLEAIREYAEDI